MTREIETVREVRGQSKTGFQPAIGPSTVGLGEHLVSSGQLDAPAAFQRVRGEALRIVSRCRPFAGPNGRTTGLVVGYVQSGKTMSMTTVAALARDNGCRIVILLAGVVTNLLKQNATRFRDTLRAAAGGHEHWLIINSADGISRGSDAQTLRHAVDEWRDGTIPDDQQRTMFFAVLKHHVHLDWLVTLLRSTSLDGIPALILDDEADQAGLNVRPGKEDPSTTYATIDRIRASLPHHTYLQYTATPQAPLLISIDDMLSPDFAELVEPGAAYTGGSCFFSAERARTAVRHIPAADQFKAGEPPDTCPDSLVTALSAFMVGCAVARLRGKPRPRSMLVHPSGRKADQKAFFEWVDNILRRWSTTLGNPKDPDYHDTLEELKKGYDDLRRSDDALPPFADLQQPLMLSLRRVARYKVNSDDGGEVDWANAEEHILVGGDKLNRGYTVEGLTVTYMPRGAGGWNADTLQQRARFFGYKAAYLGLCRLYLHPEVATAYREYVVHERDIRRQLKEHAGKPLREWRRAFFLDKRMKPTRSNVLSDPLYRQDKAQEWFVQRYPHVDANAIKSNRDLVLSFMKQLEPKRDGSFHKHRVAEASLQRVLNDLLLEFRALRETAGWYAQLVTLSNLLEQEPDTRVLVLDMDGPRERAPDKSTGALTLHQGRSSSKRDGVYEGDKHMRSPSGVTLQLHTVTVKGTDTTCSGLALCIPAARREADIVVQAQRS
ncbi:MAG: hypothetical protein KC657_37375 [Myxococcales bacterium]|nr:hypothetical protein [Myxococcales bacterium]